jgi:hypothetical protein
MTVPRGAAASNPLAGLALSAPAWLASSLSTAGRLLGLATAIFIAADQSYDPTQVFAGGVGAIVLICFVPLRRTLGTAVAALGAGTLFFSASLLLGQGAGVAMMIFAVVAIIGSLMGARRDDEDLAWPAVAFFSGLALTFAWWSIVYIAFEGGHPIESGLP